MSSTTLRVHVRGVVAVRVGPVGGLFSGLAGTCVRRVRARILQQHRGGPRRPSQRPVAAAGSIADRAATRPWRRAQAPRTRKVSPRVAPEEVVEIVATAGDAPTVPVQVTATIDVVTAVSPVPPADLVERVSDTRYPPTTSVELDERKRAVLCAIVTGFIATGQPVGSAHVVEAAGLDVSAATVRSDMGALEELGLVTQPHTSAGRVPTDRGYRWFVDDLRSAPRMDPRMREIVEELLGSARDVEDLLARTTTVLSQLTRLVSLVISPAIETARLRLVELVSLGSHSALLLLVSDTGRVEKHPVDLPADGDERDVDRVRRCWRTDSSAAASERVGVTSARSLTRPRPTCVRSCAPSRRPQRTCARIACTRSSSVDRRRSPVTCRCTGTICRDF